MFLLTFVPMIYY